MRRLDQLKAGLPCKPISRPTFKVGFIYKKGKTPKRNPHNEEWEKLLNEVSRSKKRLLALPKYPKGIYINKYNRNIFKRFKTNLTYYRYRVSQKEEILDLGGIKIPIGVKKYKEFLKNPFNQQHSQFVQLMDTVIKKNVNMLKIYLISTIFYSPVRIPLMDCLRHLGSGYYQIVSPVKRCYTSKLFYLLRRFPSSITIRFLNTLLADVNSVCEGLSFATNKMWAFYKNLMSVSSDELRRIFHFKRLSQLIAVYVG